VCSKLAKYELWNPTAVLSPVNRKKKVFSNI
jgi:hypothetical protein